MAVVIDLTDAPMFSATMRKVGSTEMDALYRSVGHKITGVAHVVGSAAMRGALTAIHWVAPPPFESSR